MKKKDLKSLRSKKIEELKNMVETKRSEAANAHVKMMAGQEKNLKKAANLRREIAQILTLIKEKEIADKIAKEEEKKDDKVAKKPAKRKETK